MGTLLHDCEFSSLTDEVCDADSGDQRLNGRVSVATRSRWLTGSAPATHSGELVYRQL
jgi:hypothetical protein